MGSKDVLTTRERRWLKHHNENIRIGITEIPPQVIYDNGKYKGIAIDYIQILKNKLGCNFKLIPFPTWHDVINAAKGKRIDMIFAAQQTSDRMKYLIFSESYISLPNMILTNKMRSGPADLKDMKEWTVAISEGSAVHEFLQKEFTNLILHPVPNELIGLKKISVGEIDAMVVEISRASYYIEKEKILNLRVAGNSGFEYQLRFAVRNDWPVLREILNKGLYSITDKEKSNIDRRWIRIDEDTIFLHKKFWMTFFWGVTIIVLLVIGVIIWNRQLHKIVTYRTLDLKNELIERKRTEKALLESEKRYKNLFHNAQVGLSRTRISDGKILECNQKMANIFGYDDIAEFVVKGVLSELYVDKDRRVKALTELQKNGFIQNKEANFYKKDGQIIWIRFDSRIFTEHGYMEDVVIDITQQKESEGKLLKQQKAILLNNKIATVFLTSLENDIFADTLDVILETLQSPYGYFGFIDTDGNLNCPSMTRNIWDKCEITDKNIVFPKDIWGGLWGDSLKEIKTMVANDGLTLPEGHIQLQCAIAVPIIHHNELIGQFVVADKKGGYSENEKALLESAASQTAPILNNFLEKQAMGKEHKRMRARIEQAQKMESVGNLAGGIAHDFNNILFPIIGMSELMMEDLEPNSLVYENAQEIYTAGNRAKSLVSQILSFSRQSEQEMMPVKFQKILKEVLKLCRSSIPMNIEIEQNIQQDCGSIWANATQLHQIGMNLITNAYHAVQDKNGKIMVQLKELILEKDDIPSLSVSPGKFVMLSVADNGPGISEEVRDKVFEPYFTTKDKGKGTGLGLAVVYGIVKDFGGDIQVLSTLGAGATFNVYLPLMKKTENGDTKALKKGSQTGDEHILIVDDEPPVARLQKLMLERLGYTVTQRVSSIEALEAFKGNPDKFDIVVSDMSMPNMTGDQLAYEIRQIKSEIPIIICTGFSDRINKERAEEIGVNGFIMKPIVKADMAEMVRKILDDSKNP